MIICKSFMFVNSFLSFIDNYENESFSCTAKKIHNRNQYSFKWIPAILLIACFIRNFKQPYRCFIAIFQPLFV